MGKPLGTSVVVNAAGGKSFRGGAEMPDIGPVLAGSGEGRYGTS
jgi:hypothetical protein